MFNKERGYVFVFILALILMFGGGMTGVASATDVLGVNLSGQLAMGYPVETNTDRNDVFNASVSPNYIIEGELVATFEKCPVIFTVGIDALENVSTKTSYNLTYPITDNIGVFGEHDNFDMKAGRADYDVTWAGAVVFFGNN